MTFFLVDSTTCFLSIAPLLLAELSRALLSDVTSCASVSIVTWEGMEAHTIDSGKIGRGLAFDTGLRVRR